MQDKKFLTYAPHFIYTMVFYRVIPLTFQIVIYLQTKLHQVLSLLKRFLPFLIVGLSFKVVGQESNTVTKIDQILTDAASGTALERELVSDSISFELRLWIHNFFYPDKIVQITKDKQDRWSYRLGFFVYKDSIRTFAFQDSLITQVNWIAFEAELDSFVTADIPSQDELKLTVKRDGEVYPVKTKNENIFSSVSDGVAYSIEIFDNLSYKGIHYNNPQIYAKKLTSAGINTTEHEVFIRFVNYLDKCVDVGHLSLTQVRYLHKGRGETKKSRKQRSKSKK